MGIIKRIFSFITNRAKKIPLLITLLIIAFVAGGSWYFYTKSSSSKKSQQQYQTANVERGTIISSVSATGQVSTANSASVTTKASGVVTNVHVKDGDKVKTGDKIADIELDLEGKQRAAQAYASYQSAKNSLQSAKDSYFTLQSSMMTKWKTYMDTAQNSIYENPDKSPKTENRNLPQFYSIMDDWLATEADYKNQEAAISQSQTSLNNAWLSYQQTAPVIYAPITGTVTGFSLQEGSVITAQSNSSGGASAQKIANIKTDAMPTISVNLTEVDTPKVAIGDKATLTFDAIPEKTFTGEVVSIDTIGAVSSGVTSYPAVIKLDSEDRSILPNMTCQASIIADTKDDVLLVPSSAIQRQNGDTYVTIMKNGNQEQNAVELGISSDTQTEIVSGLSSGDTVIISSINRTATQQSGTQTQSIFGGGSFGRMGH